MSSIEPNDPLFSEAELKRVLEVWVAPEPSKTLDERVSTVIIGSLVATML